MGLINLKPSRYSCGDDHAHEQTTRLPRGARIAAACWQADMNALCFGGSFNPIHLAHLICARAAAEVLGFDRVMLIPSALPPHKPKDRDIAPAEHRLAMCRLAVKDDPLFIVDDLEIRRGGPSYTIDTVHALRQAGHDEVHWLIGADMLNYLPQWHLAGKLVKETQFIVMRRPGRRLNWSKLPKPFQPLHQRVVNVPQIDISATIIRERLRMGRSIAYLVSDAVGQYIHAQRLYSHHP